MRPQATVHSYDTQLPFALLHHEAALSEESTLLGEPDQDWSWEPQGSLRKDQLGIYATGGNSTTQKSGFGGNQWDHGEFQ